ncbi:MAG TPA: N-acetylmuramoyl-L-alanine amidase [Haliangiales bacterium]|nr:N-acetylmuramoyl-L-alanine amidase [Haliangiales bacterium]
MPYRKGSGEIIVGGQRYKCDFNVVNFADTPYWDASKQTCIPMVPGGPVQCGAGGMPFAPAKGITKPVRSRPRRLEARDRTAKVAQSYLRQFVIHLDGCINADSCWDVLQNERGLSCHFILDNDGTLYQTLDLIDCAYHAAGLNETSIGIEICNRGDAKYEGDYARANLKPREVVTCNIHGEKYVALDFTKEQYATMDELAKVFAKVLPGIAINQPKGGDGGALWTTIIDERTDPTGQRLRELYTGYLGHYHITKQKWDPGPFDFTKFLTKMRGRSAFPIGLHDLAKKQEVPDKREALAAATKVFYRNNEEEGGGGFFPVGPFEPYRLWHGGVHLHAAEGEKVYAPWPGQIVAARNIAYQTGIASVNFVLIKHHFAVKGVDLEFFTLYFHLRHEGDDKPKKDRLRWMTADQWLNRDLGTSRPAVFDPPQAVQAGDVVGYVGRAGPDAEPQIHFEIFFADRAAVKKLDPGGFWTLVSGEDNRFCTAKEIVDKIDKKKPKGILDRSEMEDFFHEDSEDRDYMRRLVTLHPSEWSNAPDWKGQLAAAAEMAKKKPKDIADLVDEQITPTLFWDDVYRAAHLPPSSNVYTFHPITFVAWLNGLQIEEKSAGSGAIKLATAADRKDAAEGRTGKAKMDLDDVHGESFVNEEDLKDIPPDKKVEMEQLIDGFGD